MSKVSVKTVALTVFGLDLLGIIIAISRAIILDRSPMRYFGENGYMTWFSTLQLLVAAFLCGQIATIRTRAFRSRHYSFFKRPQVFWWLASAGMAFFALDETLEIHENLDKSIHRWLGIQSTSISGRLDDFIVLFYAGLGLLAIYTFRRELSKYRMSLSWFVWGLGFSFLTICLDMLGHSRETFTYFADNLEQLNKIHHWVGAIEEMPKILAGGAFIVTLYACKLIAKNIGDRYRISPKSKVKLAKTSSPDSELGD